MRAKIEDLQEAQTHLERHLKEQGREAELPLRLGTTEPNGSFEFFNADGTIEFRVTPNGEISEGTARAEE